MPQHKILLVDDSPTVILWQRLILEGESFQVCIATDGEEALQVARSEQPDLILLDVVMPRMNGFAACRALRQDAELRDVPILMVTTRSEMASVMEGFSSGCNEYITKPIDRAELLAKVRNYLELPESAQ